MLIEMFFPETVNWSVRLDRFVETLLPCIILLHQFITAGFKERLHFIGNMKRFVHRPADGFLGYPRLVGAERLAVGRSGVLLVRAPLTDMVLAMIRVGLPSSFCPAMIASRMAP